MVLLSFFRGGLRSWQLPFTTWKNTCSVPAVLRFDFSLALPFLILCSMCGVAATVSVSTTQFRTFSQGYGEYNGFMKAAQQLLVQHGLEGSVLGPEAFCPLDYWQTPVFFWFVVLNRPNWSLSRCAWKFCIMQIY